MKLEFLDRSVKKCSNIKFHEKKSLGGELFHLDRQTDITKLIVPLRIFANAPKTGETKGHIGTENSKERI